jgi:hypothetical protein
MLPLVLRYVAFETTEQWEQANYCRLSNVNFKAMVSNINFIKLGSVF